MKSQFVDEEVKLKNSQHYLEKNDALNIISKFGGEIGLAEYLYDLEKDRVSESDAILKELKHIRSSLTENKDLIKDTDIKALDLKSFKKSMVELQERIQNFKTKLKLNLVKLKDEEDNLYQEIEFYHKKKLESWEKPTRGTKIANLSSYSILSRPVISSKNITNSKDVAEFIEFVSKSGHENGWSSEDHQLFLKFRKKSKSVESLAVQLHKLLPDISEEEIVQHEAWYGKYTDLKNRKKEALETWRKGKNQERAEMILAAENKPEISTNKSGIISRTMDLDRENLQAKLSLWKMEKAKKHQEQLQIAQSKKDQLEKLQAERQRFKNEVKMSVQKWKDARQLKEQSHKYQKELQAQHEKRLKSMEANKLIKQFQSQDDLYINKVKQIKESRIAATPAVVRSKSSQLRKRDPDNILKPTKQWLLRSSKDDDQASNVHVFVPDIRTIPKLRVPEWKRTLK